MGHLPHLSGAADRWQRGIVSAHPADPARPRRAEVVAALSLALDLGLGQPMEHMLRAAMIATRLADRIGLDATERGVVFYAELVSWIGCQADSPELTALFADEIAFRAGTFPVDLRGLGRARFLLGQAGHGRPLVDRGRATVRMLADGHRQMQELLASHYASAGALADRLGWASGSGTRSTTPSNGGTAPDFPAESAARPSRSPCGSSTLPTSRRSTCAARGRPPPWRWPVDAAAPSSIRRSWPRWPGRPARSSTDWIVKMPGRRRWIRRPTRIEPCPIPSWMLC